MRIDRFQVVIFAQQRERRLLPDAFDAGDIVGHVPHQRFFFDDLRRREADFFIEIFLGQAIDVRDAALGEAHAHPVRDQLKTVPVSRIDDGFYAVKGARKRADEIVRLVSRKLYRADAHGTEQILQYGDLHGEFFRHGFSRALVFRIQTMAESGRVYVKGDGDVVGFFFAEDAKQQLDKPEDPVGGKPLFGGKDAERIEGAVQKAVAVDQYKFIHVIIVARIGIFCNRN